MGFNLGIGEFSYCVEYDERYVSVSCESHSAKGAPLDPTGTDGSRGNWNYPSYTQWRDFSRKVGLEALFYAQTTRGPDRFVGESGGWHDGLLSLHPGAQPLTADHLAAFRHARERWTPAPGDDGVCWVLRRLDWLCFWTEWALKNCKHPTFANS